MNILPLFFLNCENCLDYENFQNGAMWLEPCVFILTSDYHMIQDNNARKPALFGKFSVLQYSFMQKNPSAI